MIYVFGSIAQDYLFQFPGRFDIDVVGNISNLSLVASHMVKVRGGTAANIAYNLRLLDVPVGIVSAVGNDAQDYVVWLQSHGIQNNNIAILQNTHTATAFIVTDSIGNQITVFFPGALNHVVEAAYTSFDWTTPSLAIISAGAPVGLQFAVEACLAHSIKYVYNPGQSLANLTSHDLIKGIKGASALLINEYELQQIRVITGFSEKELFDLGLLIVVTLGSKGSVLRQVSQEVTIPAVQPKTYTDPTGAGDAYCAGLVKGIIENQNLETMGRLASLAATYAVEWHGPIEHIYKWSEFVERYKLEYGDSYELKTFRS